MEIVKANGLQLGKSPSYDKGGLSDLSRTIDTTGTNGVELLFTKGNCKTVGLLGGKYEKAIDCTRRVYSADGYSPTITTCGGGNTEPKIMEETVFKEPFALDEQNSCIRHETIGCLTTDGSSPKHNNRIVEPNECEYRVRKLTEKECGRLMGVKDNDIEKIGKNLSRSAQYHCFGDSIVTTCLMAIFGQLLGQNQTEIETKIQTTINEIRSGNNGKQQTTNAK